MHFVLFFKALVGISDVEAFWQIRKGYLKKGKLNCFNKLLVKIIRKRYGAGIPILSTINSFRTPHGFYGIFISQDAKIGENCIIYHQVTIGSNNIPIFRGGTVHWG